MVIEVTLLADEWTQSTKGGISTLNRQLAIQLANHPNVKANLLIPKCSPEDKQDTEKYGIKVFEPEEHPGYNPIDRLAFPPKEFHTDVVIGHSVKLGKQGSVIRERYGCKWMHVVHTNPEELGLYKTYSGAISTGEDKHEDEVEICKSADMVVAIGPKLKGSISRSLCHAEKEVFQLTPGVFDELNCKVKCQEDDKFYMLVFGRGDSEDFKIKGFDVAAKTVAALNQEDPTYHLEVVGAPDGKQEELAEKLFEHGIDRNHLNVKRFYKDRKKLAELFSKVDLCLMPSATEGFGLTALEALSAGLPVLVSRNSGIAEALVEVSGGLQCIVQCEDDWAKEIKKVRKHLKIRQAEAKDLREKYKERYPWKDQCEELVEKMQKMCSDTAVDKVVQEDLSNKEGLSSAQKRPKDLVQDTQENALNKEGSPYPGQKRLKVSPSDPDKGNGRDTESGLTSKVKTGSPSLKELSELAYHICKPWKILGRLLNVDEPKLDGIDEENKKLSEKAYQMLLSWKQGNVDAATYHVLDEALSDKQVGRSDLAKDYCY